MIHSERVPKSFCTTREAAELLGVSLRTVQLWTENGLLDAWKTDGGHRRVSRESIARLLVNPAARPEPESEPDSEPPGAVRDAGARADPAADASTDPLADAPLSILVVDDEQAMRQLYVANMTRWALPVKVSVARDGYEALIRIGRQPPDLLVTDLHMPGGDGVRMLHTLQQSPELERLTIVVVTALESAEIRARGGVPEGITVLPKPVPFDGLLRIAERVCAARRSSRSALVR